MVQRHKFVYEGPVFEFDKCVVDCWRGTTIAESKGKAISNLAYQYKKNNNRLVGTKVTLPGEITTIY